MIRGSAHSYRVQNTGILLRRGLSLALAILWVSGAEQPDLPTPLGLMPLKAGRLSQRLELSHFFRLWSKDCEDLLLYQWSPRRESALWNPDSAEVNKQALFHTYHLLLKGFRERKEIRLLVPEQLAKPMWQPVSLSFFCFWWPESLYLTVNVY